MKDVLFEMTRKRLGLTTVVDADGRLMGLISDGDLRRGMERHGYTFLDHSAEQPFACRVHVLSRGPGVRRQPTRGSGQRRTCSR